MGVNFPIKYKGKGYWTYKDLCKGLKIPFDIFTEYKKTGVSLQVAVKRTEEYMEETKEVFDAQKEKEEKENRLSNSFKNFRGVEYSSLEQLCLDYGVPVKEVVSELDRDKSVEEIIENMEKALIGKIKDKERLKRVEEAYNYSMFHEIVFLSMRYPSAIELCKELEYDLFLFNRKIREGLTQEKIFSFFKENKPIQKSIEKRYGQEITYRGKTFKNKQDLYELVGITSSAIVRRMDRGLTLLEVMDYYVDLNHNGILPLYKVEKKSTNRTGREIDYKGFRYKNIEHLGKELDIDIFALLHRVDSGSTLEEAIDFLSTKRETENRIIEESREKEEEPNTFTYLGLTYSGRRSFFKLNGVLPHTIYGEKKEYKITPKSVGKDYSAFRKNRSTAKQEEEKKELVEKDKHITISIKNVSYKGVEYKNLNNLCKDLGVLQPSLKNLLDKGETLETAVDWLLVLKSKKEPIVFRGVEYKHLNHLKSELNLSLAGINNHLKQGNSLIQAIEQEMKTKEKSSNIKTKVRKRKGKRVTYKNKAYDSLKELCRFLDVSYGNVYSRKQLGYSTEEAIEYVLNNKK